MDTTEIFLNSCMSDDEIHSEIAAKLRFPENYGKNSDSLRDCLSKMDSCHADIYIPDDNSKNNKIESITDIFKAFSENKDDFSVNIIKDEFLNIVDESEHVTSTVKPRSLVHRDGDLHLTVHIWIVKKTDMGIYILLQKRSANKKVHPDCYDVSAAGHVSAGEEIKYSAVRELEEELGIVSDFRHLEFLGTNKSKVIIDNQNGKIIDNELAAVYIYREPVKIHNLTNINREEVSDVCWMDIDECMARINDESFSNCIKISELKMIKKKVL